MTHMKVNRFELTKTRQIIKTAFVHEKAKLNFHLIRGAKSLEKHKNLYCFCLKIEHTGFSGNKIVLGEFFSLNVIFLVYKLSLDNPFQPSNPFYR